MGVSLLPRLPNDVCPDYFAGFCGRVGCPLRHVDDESIIIYDEAQPSSPRPQPTTASTPTAPHSPTLGTDGPSHGGSDVPVQGGDGYATELGAPAPVPTPPRADGAVARVSDVEEKSDDGQGRSKSKLCRNIRKHGFCLDNLQGACSMFHPAPGEEVDFGSDCEDEAVEKESSVQCPPCPDEGEMRPDSTLHDPNGPPNADPSPVPVPSIPAEIDNVDDLPSEPDEASPPSTPAPKSPPKSTSDDASSPGKRPPQAQDAVASVESPSKRHKPTLPAEDDGRILESTPPREEMERAQSGQEVDTVRNKVVDMSLNLRREDHGLTMYYNMNSNDPPSSTSVVSPSGHLNEDVHFGALQDTRGNAMAAPYQQGPGRGKRKKKKGRGGRTGNSVVSTPPTVHKAAVKNEFYCFVCNVDCNSKMNLTIHEKGKSHKRKQHAKQYAGSNAFLEDEYRKRTTVTVKGPPAEGNPNGGHVDRDSAPAAALDPASNANQSPSAEAGANASPSCSPSPTSVAERSADGGNNGSTSNAVESENCSSPKASTGPGARDNHPVAAEQQMDAGAKSDIAKTFCDSSSGSEWENAGVNGVQVNNAAMEDKTMEQDVDSRSVDLRIVAPADVFAASNNESPTVGINNDKESADIRGHSANRKARGSRFTDNEPNVAAAARGENGNSSVGHVTRSDQDQKARKGSRFKAASASTVLGSGAMRDSNAERAHDGRAPSTRVSTVSRAAPTFVPFRKFQDYGVPSSLAMPMDTSNDNARAASEQMDTAGEHGSRMDTAADDARRIPERLYSAQGGDMASNAVVNAVEPQHEEFKFAGMNKAPSREDLIALRNCAHLGGSQTLAFKLILELVLSPTIGIGLDDLDKLMEYLEKVPLYRASNDPTCPFMFSKDLDPQLLMKKSDTLIEGDEDGAMKKAVDIFTDNVKYVLTEDVTEGEQAFCETNRMSSRAYRGRWGSKDQLNRAGEPDMTAHVSDDITVDPMFARIQMSILHCAQIYHHRPPPPQ